MLKVVRRSLIRLPNEAVVHILEPLPARRDILSVGAVCDRRSQTIYSKLTVSVDVSTVETTIEQSSLLQLIIELA